LRSSLDSLARHLRRRWLLRGAGWLALLAVVLFVAGFVADSCFTFSAPALRYAFAACAAILMILGLRLFLPLCRALRLEALAAVIERRHADLGERLSSTVELAGREEMLGHGSPSFIALLEKDTEARIGEVDVAKDFPLQGSRRLAVLGGLVLLLAAVPAFIWDRYADFGERFLLSWIIPELRLEITVSPGDAAVARGRPLTLTGQVKSPHERLPLPEKCHLSYRVEDGAANRIPLRLGADGAFSFHFDSVPGDIHYHVTAGNGDSPSYKLSSVVPVELAKNPTVRITPPAYVNAVVHPPLTTEGDFDALQYSNVVFALSFNRDPVTATVELKATQGVAKEWRLSLAAVQETEASWQLPALPPGVYSLSLILEAEQHITTRQHLANVTIWSDEAPVFIDTPRLPALVAEDSMSASVSQAATVPPEDSLPLQIKVEDRVGLDRIEVEYRVNGKSLQLEVIAQADGQTSAAREFRWRLPANVKQGDVLALRLKASDNRRLVKEQYTGLDGRRVPRENLEPHVVYEPAPLHGKDRWHVLRIDQQARPWNEQQILAQRDTVGDSLRKIKQQLQAEQKGLKALLADHAKPSHSADELERKLKNLHQENAAVRDGLHKLAEQVAGVDALQDLAALAQDIARKELSRSDQDLTKAARLDAGPRAGQLRAADKELSSASARLDAMLAKNDRVAEARLVQTKMERLAQKQEELGTQAAKAATKPDLDKLTAGEERLAKAVQDLAEQSRLARENPDQAKLAGKQAELADKIAKLLSGPQTSGADAAIAKNAASAAEALKKGDADVALQMQHATAHNLERLAEEWSWGMDLQAAPAKAVGDLARLRNELVKALEKLGEDFTRLRIEEVRRRLKELERRQQDLRKAAQAVKLPMASRDGEGEHKRALDHLGQVLDWFQRRDFLQAHDHMEQAQAALEQLSRRAPTAEVAGKQAKAKTAAPAKIGEARQLAQEQHDLQAMVQKLAPELRQAKSSRQGKPDPEMKKVAEAFQQGQDQVTKALAKLRQGDPKAARPAMQQAAKALRQAANQAGKQLAQAQKSSSNAPAGTTPGRANNSGVPTARDLPKDLQQYLGRPWGELPGELRTRILQDVRARFGDDYARMIQSYFEKIVADSLP
jgi:hypothetical protein